MKYLITFLLTCASVIVANADLVDIPAYKPTKSGISKARTIQITTKQTAKITPLGEGLAVLQMEVSQLSIPDLCSVKDRKLTLQLQQSQAIYNYQQDSNGFATSDVPFIISWQQLFVKSSLFNANFVNVDSQTSISLFKADPTTTSLNPITSLSLTQYFTIQDIMMSGIFIGQIGSSIFLAYEISSQLKFLRVYAPSSGTILTATDFPITINNLSTLGSLVDLIGFSENGSESGVLLLLFETGLVGVHIKAGVFQKFLLTQAIPGTDLHDFVNIRAYLPIDAQPSPNPLQIYILCQNKGLYRYNLDITALDQGSVTMYYESTFHIDIAYGTVFNHYRGRIFFINTSANPYQTYEYEVILDNTGNYYLNRMHDTDHKVKDIIVQNYYFILSGSNSQTVSWHSVHPTLVADIVPKQQFYSIYGLSGGAILSFYNSTISDYEEYFIGFQSRHIFMYKAIHITPYLVCEPKTVSDPSSLVGQHQFMVTLVQQNYLKQNSYQVVEGQSNWILQVDEVYASSLTAGAIAGIVISVVVVFIGLMVLIWWKIKKQKKQQQQLYQEIEQQKQKQTRNFSALKEDRVDAQSDAKSSNLGEDNNNNYQVNSSFEKPKRQQFSSRFGMSEKSSDVNSSDSSRNNKENTPGNQDQVDKLAIHVGDQQGQLFIEMTPGENKNEGEQDNKIEGKNNSNNEENDNQKEIIQFVESDDEEEI